MYPDVKAKLELGIYSLSEYPPADVAAKICCAYSSKIENSENKDDFFNNIYTVLMKHNVREIATKGDCPIPLYLIDEMVGDYKVLEKNLNKEIKQTVKDTNSKSLDTRSQIEEILGTLNEIKKNSLNSELEKFSKDIGMAISSLNRAIKDLQSTKPLEGQMDVFDFLDVDDEVER